VHDAPELALEVAVVDGVEAYRVVEKARSALSSFAAALEKAGSSLVAGFEVTVTDSAPGALPGLDRPAAKAFVAAVGGQVGPKFGWTDVARFTTLGVPAVNFGPGDPTFAHKQDEHVAVSEIEHCERVLRAWLVSD